MKPILLVCFVSILFTAMGCSGFKASSDEWSVRGSAAHSAAGHAAAASAQSFRTASSGYIAQDALTDCRRVAESFNVEDPMIPRTVEVVYDIPCLHRHLTAR